MCVAPTTCTKQTHTRAARDKTRQTLTVCVSALRACTEYVRMCVHLAEPVDEEEEESPAEEPLAFCLCVDFPSLKKTHAPCVRSWPTAICSSVCNEWELQKFNEVGVDKPQLIGTNLLIGGTWFCAEGIGIRWENQKVFLNMVINSHYNSNIFNIKLKVQNKECFYFQLI